MNFYDCLQLENWRQLTPEGKGEIFYQLTKHVIHPRLAVTNEQLTTFELCGYRCETFECLIGDEEFVFIPGQKGINLGWEQGVEGLRLEDLIEEKLAEHGEKLTRYRTTLSLEQISDVEQEFLFEFEDKFSAYVEQIAWAVDRSMSPFRRVDIPPMIVAKHSQAVGTKFVGKYQIVAGEFFGDDEFWLDFSSDIQEQLRPPLSLSESLTWEYPKHFFQNNQYYLEQHADLESYHVYRHKESTYGDVWLTLHQQGFQLLGEDSFEYAIGAGTRRLFRWGNEIKLTTEHPFKSALNKLLLPNMFGLDFSNQHHAYELTDQSECLKLAKEPQTALGPLNAIISQASYYRPNEGINPSEYLDPLSYRYRKSIVIQRN